MIVDFMINLIRLRTLCDLVRTFYMILHVYINGLFILFSFNLTSLNRNRFFYHTDFSKIHILKTERMRRHKIKREKLSPGVSRRTPHVPSTCKFFWFIWFGCYNRSEWYCAVWLLNKSFKRIIGYSFGVWMVDSRVRYISIPMCYFVQVL